MNFKEIIFNNFWYKIFSIICGILLWFVVIGQQQSEITIELPLEFKNVPQNYIITRSMINKISVVLSGPSTLLKLVTKKELSFPVDLSNIHKGENELVLYPEALDLPHKITVRLITPATIKLYIDKIISQKKIIIPSFKGEVAKGYRVKSVSIDPSQVTVVAAEDSLKKIDKLTTEPIDLTDKKESFQTKIPIMINKIKFLKKISTLQVKVTINIEEHFIKKSIKDLPITIKTSLDLNNYNFTIIPSKVNITYEISENFAKLIKKGDFTAFIELNNFDNNSIPVQIKYPQHINILNFSPKYVKIKFKKRGKK